MTWLASFFVALLTGVAGLFISGFCASLAVDWYHVSSFEGGSGYFVVFLALGGGLAAFVVGMVVARTAAAAPLPSFVRALATSLAFVVIGNGAIAGVARLLADIPPELDGERLLLDFQLQWPASQTADPRTTPGVPRAHLGVSSGGSVRKQDEGAFLLEDARVEGGRWVAPGAAHLFTSRGKPILLLEIGNKSLGGFELPIPSHPTDKDREWSEWMPHPKKGAPPLPDGFRVRYRVVKTSVPFRTQHVGPFEISTASSAFSYSGADVPASSQSTFRVLFNGKSVAELDSLSDVAVVGGPLPALLVARGSSGSSVPMSALVYVKGDSLVQESINSTTATLEPRLLTNDPKQFEATKKGRDVRGWLDFTTFASPGLYRISESVVDTRRLTTKAFSYGAETYPPDPPGIIGISPDEKSVVWIRSESDSLGVTNYVDKHTYTLPIDHRRMRFVGYASLDPAWVDHHFTWTRGANGIDSLVVRQNFIPLPYHGDLALARPGEYQSWTIAPGSEALRDVLFSALVARLGGEVLPQAASTVTRTVRVEGKSLDVFLNDTTYVSVSISGKDAQPDFMRKVAAALDAELATGKHDALLAPKHE